jgi:hypothetical protein
LEFPPPSKTAAVCKPSSVPVAGCPVTGAAISLGRLLPGASSNLPAEVAVWPPRPGQGLLRIFGLAAGGVYLAGRVAPTAVRSYRTISPLPEQWAVCSRQWAGKDAFPFLPTAHCRLPTAPAVSFLLHFPSDCSASTLSSTVPCAARTFLTGLSRKISTTWRGHRCRRSR